MRLHRIDYFRGIAIASVGLVLVAGTSLMGAGPAQAASTLDGGPVDLGTSKTFGVLGASSDTNTGSSVISGDVGVSPGTSITGFPPGVYSGTRYLNDAVALQAHADLTTAYNSAKGLTPTLSGLDDLSGESLTPGVYSGGALSLTGELTLDGTADSVWVFQAASTLITGSGSKITLTGGATSCNVFWQVGSSATLGTTSEFVGTIMADQSITATTGATVAGRLLARTGAVTLDSNTITLPAGCNEPGTVTERDSPAMTSGPPTSATEGTPYSFSVTASGTPAPTFAVTTGTLPAGLSLDATTGLISGIPTTEGVSKFRITASNEVSPSVMTIYRITVAAAAAAVTPGLAATGGGLPLSAGIGGSVALAFGLGLLIYSRARRGTRSAD